MFEINKPVKSINLPETVNPDRYQGLLSIFSVSKQKERYAIGQHDFEVLKATLKTRKELYEKDMESKKEQAEAIIDRDALFKKIDIQKQRSELAMAAIRLTQIELNNQIEGYKSDPGLTEAQIAENIQRAILIAEQTIQAIDNNTIYLGK